MPAGRQRGRLPWVTAAVAVVAVLVHAAPGWSDLLQLSWPGVASGEWWRVVTGQLTHWSWRHLWWDVATFAVVAGICEVEDRRRFTLCLALSLTLLPALLYGMVDELTLFRGLSGVDCAVFALAATTTALASRGRASRLGCAALSMLAAKILFEAMSGGALFVSDAVVATVPAAHALGAAIGMLCACWRSPLWVPARSPIRAMGDGIHMSLLLSESLARR